MNYSDILRFRIAALNGKEFTIDDLIHRDIEMTDKEHEDFIAGAKSSIGKLVQNKEIQVVLKTRHPKGYFVNTMKVLNLRQIRNKVDFQFRKERKKYTSVWQDVYPDLFTIPEYLLKFTKKRIHSVPY